MEQTEYVTTILSSSSPSNALQIRKDRLSLAKVVHSELADWIGQRALAEDAYVMGDL
jgi:hypothetical protein